MKIGVIGVGQVVTELLAGVAHELSEASSVTLCDVLAVPEYASERKRRQYNSTQMLTDIQFYAAGRTELDRVMGVVDLDVYALGLNYVFGEAFLAGKAGLGSIWRLKLEF